MSNGAQARDPLGLIEAGRLSASDLEHPNLQPLLLPLDKFDGKHTSSRLPGAVVRNPGARQAKALGNVLGEEQEGQTYLREKRGAPLQTPRPSPKTNSGGERW